MQLKEGTLLQSGKYRIVRFINSGGFGCTYEAVHTSLDDRFAIKEFFVKDFCNRDENTSYVTVGTNSKKALVEKLKVKFINEAKSIRKLHHNGIVKVSDVFEENGTAYYVMDYIEGQTLGQLIDKKGRLSEAETLRYIRQVSDTLKYVHSNKMLHLDIKPGNIMIDEDDTAILIDFGTSKQYDEVDGENTSTLLGKTPGYAPLEQMDNSVQVFYPATDIYALGATMYKMLTGITPPESNLRSSGEVELEALPPYVDKVISDAIYKSLSLNKQSRPQSIEEFLNVFDKSERSRKSGPSDDSSKSKKTSTANEETVIETSERKNKINGHEYVDLGLPSGLKWATCNVGANSPEEYGDYYAWGETYTKDEYDEDNCDLWEVEMENIGGDPDYDVATSEWGEEWRLPTKEDFEELVEECEWKWMKKKGVNGMRVTGPNGKSIFLPAAGFRYGSSLINEGDDGRYWSSTPIDGSYDDHAYYLFFYDGDESVGRIYYRDYGLTVRPITE